ncbi:isotrichodermin C-15 hydroxylase [Apiospora phragmitis]|uniref:Isotrichodermin C-15 hydroxylase n=1 Tax=Apiospora phragmitis TaxID=2905665 RepID=A0ABR1VGR4_9PEZI
MDEFIQTFGQLPSSRAPLLALAVPVTVLLWAVGKAVYNVYFHPLASYPGPLLARATRLYHAYYDIKGVSIWKVKDWHEKYGPIVRIAPDELSYTDSRAWPAIYGFPNRDGTGNFEKDPQWWNKAPSGILSIVDADDAGHRFMRRLQSPAFSDKALRAQERVIRGYIDLLIQKLHGQASDPDTAAAVDLTAWYNFTTFDIIGDLAFGEPFHCLRDAVWHWWIDAVFDLFQDGVFMRAARRFSQPLPGILAWLFVPKKLVKNRMDQFMFTVERVNSRLQLTTDGPDFLSYILNAEGEKAMSMEETYVCTQVLIVAGSETTATALTGATYLLLENPEKLERLTAEIQTRFESETDITIQTTAELPYLNAVVQESLRLCPPGPAVFPSSGAAGGQGSLWPVRPRRLHGWGSPARGRSVEPQLCGSRVVHPERWLGDPRFEKDDKAACQPFSYGPRNCIGKNLAMAEIKTILSRVIWNFDMGLHPASRGWLNRQKAFTSWKKEELKVALTPKPRK